MPVSFLLFLPFFPFLFLSFFILDPLFFYLFDTESYPIHLSSLFLFPSSFFLSMKMRMKKKKNTYWLILLLFLSFSGTDFSSLNSVNIYEGQIRGSSQDERVRKKEKREWNEKERERKCVGSSFLLLSSPFYCLSPLPLFFLLSFFPPFSSSSLCYLSRLNLLLVPHLLNSLPT